MTALRLQVLSAPGAAPDAILTRALAPRASGRLFAIGGRILGARGAFDAQLSHEWGCLVYCTPEFSAWWRPRATAGAAAPRSQIFLEVKAA